MVQENGMKKLGMTLKDNSGTRFYEKTGVTSGELMYCIDDRQEKQNRK